MGKTDKVLFSSATVEWETPQAFFDKLNEEFHFTLDPCSTDENAKCEKHYTLQENGLLQDWTGEIVYCNPPYGKDMPEWIHKCYRHFLGGVLLSCCFLPEQIQRLFMNTYTAKQKYGLFADG